MPSKDGEEAMNARDEEPPCTPPRPTGNGGGGRSLSVGQMNSDEESDADLQDGKKKRKWNDRREFTLIKRWVTGEKAEMDSEDIEQEIFELVRDWMSQSNLKQLHGHQSDPTNVSLWTQYREYKAKKVSVFNRLFRCPLHHQCGCQASIRIREGPEYMQLD